MMASLDAEERQKVKKKQEYQHTYQCKACPKCKVVHMPAPTEKAKMHTETKNVGGEDMAKTVRQHLPHSNVFMCEDCAPLPQGLWLWLLQGNSHPTCTTRPLGACGSHLARWET